VVNENRTIHYKAFARKGMKGISRTRRNGRNERNQDDALDQLGAKEQHDAELSERKNIKE
jgi:hypothetical protein